MAIIERVFIFPGIASALSAAQANMRNRIEGDAFIYTWTFGIESYSGATAIWFQFVSSPTNGEKWRHVIVDFAFGSVLPLYEIARSPGLQLARAKNLADETQITNVFGQITTVFEDAKLSWIEDLTGESGEELATELTERLAGKIYNGILVTKYATSVGMMVLVDTFMYVDSSELPSPQFVQQVEPALGASQAVVGVSVDTSGIVEALQDIALQDQEVSINQNAAAWSIKGKVLVP